MSQLSIAPNRRSIWKDYSRGSPGKSSFAIALAIALILHICMLAFFLFHRESNVMLQASGRPVSSSGVEVTLVSAPTPPAPTPPPDKPKTKVAPRSAVGQHSHVLVTRARSPLPDVVQEKIPDTPAAQSVSSTTAVAQPSAPAPVVPTLNLPGENAVKNGAHLSCTIPQPAYPGSARRLGHQGTVTLSVTVGKTGKIELASVAVSSGFDELDEAAMEAVRDGRCQPYIEDGEARTASARQPITFRLSN